MKILSVNVKGLPSSVSSDFNKANVLQDYDVVVIDPKDLECLFGDVDYVSGYNEDIIDPKWVRFMTLVNVERSEQAQALLKRSGAIICLMRSEEYYPYYSDGKKSFVSNYDWLKYMGLGVPIENGRGTTIDYIDQGYPFAKYINTKPSWSAYVEKEKLADWKILASAFGTHVVALATRVGLGHVVLLPSDYDYHKGELFENCIDKLLGDKEATPQPTWAKTIQVPGQEAIITQITEVNNQINSLEKKREDIIKCNSNLDKWKLLLYGKGKHELEPVVREVLSLLGCRIELQPDKDSDGLVIFDCGSALLEIVGSKGTIKSEKLGELMKNMGNFIAKKGGKIKGILVGNPFCEEPLDNRPPKENQKQFFAKEMVESSEQQSITLLLSSDLYELVCSILSGRSNDKEKKSIQEVILNSKGLVRLSASPVGMK